MTDDTNHHDRAEQFDDESSSTSTSRRTFVQSAGASAGALALGTSVVSADDHVPTITVDLADDEIGAGETTTATFAIENAPGGFLGWNLEIGVDPDVAQIVGVEYSDEWPAMLESDFQDELEEDYDGAASSFEVRATDFGGAIGDDDTEAGLCTYVIEGVGDGVTDINLESFALTPPGGDGMIEEANYDTPSLTVGGGSNDGSNGEPDDGSDDDSDDEPTGTPTVTVDPSESEIGAGDTTTVDLGLSEAPNGVLGFSLQISVDTDVATIADAGIGETFPDEIVGSDSTVEIEDGVASLRSLDMNEAVQAGATDIDFGYVELEGVAGGETAIDVTESEATPIQDDDGEYIEPEFESASLVVGDGETDETPSPPEDVEIVESGETSIEVEWSADPNAVSYNVYIDDSLEAETDATSASITGLESGETYQISVSAVGEDGTETDTTTVTASTADDEPPEVPTLTVDLANPEIDPDETTTVDFGLTSAPNGVLGFNVQISVDSGVATIADAGIGESFPEQLVGDASTVVIEDGAVTLRSIDMDEGVEAGATDIDFGYVELEGAAGGETAIDVEIVRLEDDDSEDIEPEIESNSLVVTGDPVEEPPNTPENIEVVATSDTSIDVEWSSVSNAASYNVYVDDSLAAETTATSASITGLEPETTYTVAVTAVGENGAESDESWVDATTDAENGESDPDSEYPEWDSEEVYTEGDRVSYDGDVWEAQWWTRGDEPRDEPWYVWQLVDGESGDGDGGDNEDGSQDEDEVDGVFAELDPTATNVGVGERVAFHVVDTTGNQNWIQDLQWDFGDGTTASGWWNAHTYESSGTYTVALTATDNEGRQTTHEVEITVS